MKTNKWIYAIVAVAAFSWTACDDDDDNFLDKPNLNDTDETFVEVAAQTNMAEIEFGELAVTKATDSLVRVFAQEMIDDHTTAQDELEELADDYAGIEWPNDLDEGNDEIMEQLNAAEGYSFDSLYMRTQVNLHAGATSFYQTATGNTTDARVKAFATKYLPRIQMHHERADSIHTVVVATAAAGEDDEMENEEGTN